MKILPVVFTWREVEVTNADDGEVTRVKAMVPLVRYGNVAARQFQDGEEYPLVVLETRTRASHNQFFAMVHEAFQNLPENLDALGERLNIKVPPGGWINEEHLRKWTLCETGWCEVDEFDFDTAEEAMRLARFFRRRDTFAQIFVRGTHVTIKTAKSQSAAAMAKDAFESSKRDVLDFLAVMVGVKQSELKKQAGRSG